MVGFDIVLHECSCIASRLELLQPQVAQHSLPFNESLVHGSLLFAAFRYSQLLKIKAQTGVRYLNSKLKVTLTKSVYSYLEEAHVCKGYFVTVDFSMCQRGVLLVITPLI